MSDHEDADDASAGRASTDDAGAEGASTDDADAKKASSDDVGAENVSAENVGAENGTQGDRRPDRDPLPTLDDTQREVVERYCAADAGLFTMDSHPGAGKSTATGKAAALLVYERYLAGDPIPEGRLLVTSFSKEDAADIVPDIVDWLWELYERGEVPGDRPVKPEDVHALERRVRDAPTIGTVDGVLRSVFAEFATEVGFEEMPTVGNEALLTQLRQDCYAELRRDPSHRDAVRRLEAAYPDSGEYDADLRELLEEALETCRQRNIAIGEFRDALHATVADVYDGGEPGSVDCLRRGIERCRGTETATTLDEVDAGELERLLAADGRLHDMWVETIDAFCRLLRAYRDGYDALTRERGVVAHVDCAHMVAAYFGREDVDSPRRDRVRSRFHDDVYSVIVDEAQDVSTVQHAALSELVTDAMSVLLVGDLKQCIYVWRSARPELFERAIREGRYFGIEWPDPVNRTATQNYRSRPDVVHAINAVASRTLPNATRGDVGALDVEYPPLRATLSGSDRPNVHVAGVSHGGTPGSTPWVTGDGGRSAGAAQQVASVLAGGVTDGSFRPGEPSVVEETDAGAIERADADTLDGAGADAIEGAGADAIEGTDSDAIEGTDSDVAETDTDDGVDVPSITVLFRRRAHMAPYQSALEARGFTVGNARVALFDTAAVRVTVAVLRWLVDPTDPARTETLVTNSPVADGENGLSAIAETYRRHHWSVSAVAEAEADRLGEGRARVVEGLAMLARHRPRYRAEPTAVVVREVVEILGLEADPLGVDPEPSRRQRLANLDGFVATVDEWEGDDAYSLARLCELLEPFVDDPDLGPDRPLVDDDVDVVLKTIHGMKGDQDEVVVLGDPVNTVGAHPLRSDRLVAAGRGIGLAPPTNVFNTGSGAEGRRSNRERESDGEPRRSNGKPESDGEPASLPSVPGFDSGLYDPDPQGEAGDIGLRWTAEHWVADADAVDGDRRLGGFDTLRSAAAETRAEAWRVLFVALTRAQHHLLVPLPTRAGYRGSPNSWIQVLYEAFEMDRAETRGTHTASYRYPNESIGEFEVAVNDVAWVEHVGSPPATEIPPKTSPLTPNWEPWLPRFVRPSTFHPLKEDPDRYVVDHFMGRALHTDTADAAADIGLPFDAVGPDALGGIVHEVIAELAVSDVPASTIRSATGETESVVRGQVRRLAEGADGEEQAAIERWIARSVLPQFAGSGLLRRVREAVAVHVEEPLEGVVRVDGVEVELPGSADFLLRMPDDRWVIEDVKVALATDDATAARYQLQLATYAWALRRQVGPAAGIDAWLSEFGVEHAETEWVLSENAVRSTLERLVSRD